MAIEVTIQEDSYIEVTIEDGEAISVAVVEGGIAVYKNGTKISTKRAINFKEGSNVTLTIGQNGQIVDVTIASAGTSDSAQSANTVKAGPESGAADTPTYRALVANDLPNIPFSKIISGTIPANITINSSDKVLKILTPDDGFFNGEQFIEFAQALAIRGTQAGDTNKYIQITLYNGDLLLVDTRDIKRGFEVNNSAYGSGYTDKSLIHRLYADNRYALLYRAKPSTYLTNSLTAGDAVNIAAVANSLRTCPLIITKPITFTQIDSCVNSAVGGTTYRLALYTDLNGYPDVLVAGSDNAAYDSASTGTKSSGAVSITLTPGLYHIAYNSNGGPLLAGWSNVSQPQVLGISSITSGSTPNVSWMVNTAYGAMPATFPVGATLQAANAVKIGLLI